ncbi:hypothetical protein K488DRAFT_67040 [Vararia minispora EC-137]|uniref:Uncharacterized protein n=1 Tax=Vararia minispora EC-137 TaxID=1314806 RepID=A0ACB8R0R4_9AGAM|nr:hypothetical protein K488DRAFT_67040 [Vararia minispora EC-137]
MPPNIPSTVRTVTLATASFPPQDTGNAVVGNDRSYLRACKIPLFSTAISDSEDDRSVTLSPVPSDLYVARSLSDLKIPSVAWTETRWNHWQWRSHEFSHLIGKPSSVRDAALLSSPERFGVEQPIVTLPTATIVSMHEDRRHGVGSRVYLTDIQIDITLEFLTEAFSRRVAMPGTYIVNDGETSSAVLLYSAKRVLSVKRWPSWSPSWHIREKRRRWRRSIGF